MIHPARPQSFRQSVFYTANNNGLANPYAFKWIDGGEEEFSEEQEALISPGMADGFNTADMEAESTSLTMSDPPYQPALPNETFVPSTQFSSGSQPHLVSLAKKTHIFLPGTSSAMPQADSTSHHAHSKLRKARPRSLQASQTGLVLDMNAVRRSDPTPRGLDVDNNGIFAPGSTNSSSSWNAGMGGTKSIPISNLLTRLPGRDQSTAVPLGPALSSSPPVAQTNIPLSPTGPSSQQRKAGKGKTGLKSVIKPKKSFGIISLRRRTRQETPAETTKNASVASSFSVLPPIAQRFMGGGGLSADTTGPNPTSSNGERSDMWDSISDPFAKGPPSAPSTPRMSSGMANQLPQDLFSATPHTGAADDYADWNNSDQRSLAPNAVSSNSLIYSPESLDNHSDRTNESISMPQDLPSSIIAYYNLDPVGPNEPHPHDNHTVSDRAWAHNQSPIPGVPPRSLYSPERYESNPYSFIVPTPLPEKSWEDGGTGFSRVGAKAVRFVPSSGSITTPELRPPTFDIGTSGAPARNTRISRHPTFNGYAHGSSREPASQSRQYPPESVSTLKITGPQTSVRRSESESRNTTLETDYLVPSNAPQRGRAHPFPVKPVLAESKNEPVFQLRRMASARNIRAVSRYGLAPSRAESTPTSPVPSSFAFPTQRPGPRPSSELYAGWAADEPMTATDRISRASVYSVNTIVTFDGDQVDVAHRAAENGNRLGAQPHAALLRNIAGMV